MRLVNAKRSLVTLCCFVVLVVSVNGQSATDGMLSGYVDAESISGNNLASVLSHLAKQSKVPIRLLPMAFSDVGSGEFAVRVEKVEKAKVVLSGSLKSKTLRGVLDEIVTTYDEFSWRMDGLIIEILPKKGTDSLAEKFLDTNVPQLFIDMRLDKLNVGSYICETDAAQQKLTILGLTDMHLYSSVKGLEYDLRGSAGSYLFQNKSVREICDEIVRKSGLKFWTVLRWGNRGQFLTIIVS